ncbi:class I SAM-dependent methyltransferase [Flavobacterium sp. GT3P67]|uniref:class I SAM-dependent methyltransferase n=1 Tax=Flavobacterium sp. GT3P67 TaxID=2541722 RepID=UPI0010481B6A|nr:class I SAM-dependent methyltransferase [Flavobacterium sp. GT3P67]TDE53946.1 class I SAM-dependent methyltransferase [Flavobacterium sp. GT3P67]
MERAENLARLQDIEKINISNTNYLVYLSFHRDLYKAIETYATGKLLDIGCGNKPYESWIKGRVSEYIGCDIVQSSSNRVDVLCQANNIPLESNSFNTILSTQVIEHVEDHQGVVNEAHRLLKSNGYFILSGPLYWNLHEEPYDFFRFTKHGFRYILEKAGFEVCEIVSNGGAWATLGQVINHTFEFKNPNANTIARGIKYLFRKLRLYILVNRIFNYLDIKDFNTINTMNYIVVARKK